MRKRQAAVEWCSKISSVQEQNWEFILLSESDFYGLTAAGATFSDLADRCKVSRAIVQSRLFDWHSSEGATAHKAFVWLWCFFNTILGSQSTQYFPGSFLVCSLQKKIIIPPYNIHIINVIQKNTPQLLTILLRNFWRFHSSTFDFCGTK